MVNKTDSLIIKVIYPQGAMGIKQFLVPGKTGHLIVFSRMQFSNMSLSDRKMFFDHVGVYVLEDTNESKYYIGEGDTILARLQSHKNKKEWDRGFAFTSQNGEMNKAHVQYVESKLIEKLKLSKKAGIVEDDNLKQESIPTLDVFDTKTAEDYLEQIISLCRVMDLNIFDKVEISQEMISNINEQFIIKRDGKIIGRMIIGKEENSNKFILLKGSLLYSKIKPGPAFPNQNTLSQLEKLGLLNEKGELLEDYVFDNPSKPGSLVRGNTSNGWVDWVREIDGATLNDILDR